MRLVVPLALAGAVVGMLAWMGGPGKKPAPPAGIGALPGAQPHEPDLAKRLARALADRGADYRPRTHHFHEDGSPKYTNRLILESSPYLVQHAHNPVDWYPWGDEAFEAARRLGRPVLLSVGYSTCHWCHVMEVESFEDEEIAAFLNGHYVAVKVDREERPDVDAVYMNAVQMMAGRGGWPMTVWLTPEREPFYGGTYFPARDGDRGARVGFLTLLRKIREQYDAKPELAAQTARQMTERIRLLLAPTPASPAAAGSATTDAAIPSAGPIEAAVRVSKQRFDAENGGASGAPKFPSNFPVRLLLREHARTADADALRMAVFTLEKMAAGGIHDQIGGGFHRYTVDGRWQVPHFEKMLYDNAQLAVAYLEAHQASGREGFAEVARRILDYVAREMTSPEGAFYSATDADSPAPGGHAEEGWFFTWTPDEIAEVVGEERAKVVNLFYGVTAQGNFEGRNIPHLALGVEEVAARIEADPGRVRTMLEESRRRLYEARSRRPPPLRDEKVLTAWNGLMIGAFAAGGRVLGDEAYTRRAARAADFVLGRLRKDGRLRRSFKDGQARHTGYLDDYAFLIAGLLDLHHASSDPRWLREAISLQATLDEHYGDAQGGGYWMTADDAEKLLAREKPAYDGAEPSGNSVALLNLLRLHELTTDDRYRATADRLLAGFGAVLERSPASLAEMLVGLGFRVGEPREIVIVTPRSRAEAEPFLEALRRTFLPNHVLVVAAEKDVEAQAKLVPLLEGKVARKGRATAYVCQRGVCKLPTSEVATFTKQIVGKS